VSGIKVQDFLNLLDVVVRQETDITTIRVKCPREISRYLPKTRAEITCRTR